VHFDRAGGAQHALDGSNTRRGLLSSDEFEEMVREDGSSGVTWNPSIFEKAIVGSRDSDEALADLRNATIADPEPPDVPHSITGTRPENWR
jgi:hypothetical protein